MEDLYTPEYIDYAIACARTCIGKGMTVHAAARVAYSMLIQAGIYRVGRVAIYDVLCMPI